MSDLEGMSQAMETQNVIIRLQSDVIAELFLMLGQHMSSSEMDALPCVRKINLAAELRAGMERDFWTL